MRNPFSMGRTPQKQEVDINLASIIDCLTVLITFTLASASFLSIGVIETGAASVNGVAPAKTPAHVSVVLRNDHSIQVNVRGSFRQSVQIPSGNTAPAAWNLANLGVTLDTWSKAHPELLKSSATIESESAVPYREIVRAIETSRKTVAWVALGGL